MEDFRFIIAGTLILTVVAYFAWQLGAGNGRRDWITAWAFLIVAAADPVIVPTDSLLNLLSPLWDHLFAMLLLTGCLRF